MTASTTTRSTRRISRDIEARAPNARLVDVPGAGHLANMEAPKAVNDLIAAFLAELGDAPAPPQPPEATGFG